nr:relaxase domain-containing protein [Streptomyces sp. 846.5]
MRYWVRGDVGCAHGLLGRQAVWAGAGLDQVGLVAGAPVDPVAAKELLYGRHPVTGRVLRRPKLVAHKDAKVDAVVFVKALRELAAGRGTEPVGLLRSLRSRDRWTRLTDALTRAKPDPLVPIKDLDRLAKDARLLLEDLYPPEALVFARANRDKKESVSVLGQGLTVNFPKSLSALAALAPPPMAAVIAREMRQVAFEVVAAAEVFAGYGLVGEQGKGHLAQHIPGLGLLAVVNPHAQARPTRGHPGDPSLHLHITLINAIPLPGGRWGAFGSSGQDLRRHIAVLGELAKARLRTRLHDRLGLTFERDRTTGSGRSSASRGRCARCGRGAAGRFVRRPGPGRVRPSAGSLRPAWRSASVAAGGIRCCCWTAGAARRNWWSATSIGCSPTPPPGRRARSRSRRPRPRCWRGCGCRAGRRCAAKGWSAARSWPPSSPPTPKACAPCPTRSRSATR